MHYYVALVIACIAAFCVAFGMSVVEVEVEKAWALFGVATFFSLMSILVALDGVGEKIVKEIKKTETQKRP